MSSGWIQWSVAAIAAVGLSACRSGNPAGPRDSWSKVTERTACEAMNPPYCVGSYGFTVTSEGRYTVGPADSGVEVSGTLSDAERSRISADADKVASALAGGPQCDAAGAVPGVSDTVDLTDAHDVVSRVYQLDFKGTCYRGGRDPALRLHDDLEALMERYYPRPFPP